MNQHRGFTLIEILVALAIIAVALGAGMRAISQSADNANLLKQRTLALWVAENRLAELQLSKDLPPMGTLSGRVAEAGIPFIWKQVVSGTPNPAFRKVDLRVTAADEPNYELARLNGYVGIGVAPDDRNSER